MISHVDSGPIVSNIKVITAVHSSSYIDKLVKAISGKDIGWKVVDMAIRSSAVKIAAEQKSFNSFGINSQYHNSRTGRVGS